MSPKSDKRLIEVAFPLKQTSLDSVHEKNVRHGHISTLHIWPARRPLAASRAALIATLLPDPGDAAKRRELCERIGGKVVQVVRKKKLPDGRVEERKVDETVGGILHWGRETENAIDLEFFRQAIREAYGGRAPRVLDPFAGGGAIPLEAMRLGCEATAIDINPVAWFILKCTLEYPQRLAGKTLPLPAFALGDREFVESFFEAKGFKKIQIRTFVEELFSPKGQQVIPGAGGPSFDASFLEADLAWQVRAWGRWVLERARKDLERYYPVVDGRPTVAYLWARTVRCKSCRAEIPLLKTLWLAKNDKRRVLLEVVPNPARTAVVFSVRAGVPSVGGNNAQRREHDKRIGVGTMTRAGASCPCCGKAGTVAMTMEDIRQEGMAGRIGQVLTAVVVAEEEPAEGRKKEPGKSYRLPTAEELVLANPGDTDLEVAFESVPFGMPDEPMPSSEALGIRVPLYGFRKWRDLHTRRQLLALGALVRHTRAARESMEEMGYSEDWASGVAAELLMALGRAANYLSTVCIWDSGACEVKQTFLRFALPITWDFAEANPLAPVDRYYIGGLSKVGRVLDNLGPGFAPSASSTVACRSALAPGDALFDVIVTDPPYYDAIPYSDLMDFFHVWFRRTAAGWEGLPQVALEPLSPKWSREAQDGELIDDSSRHAGDSGRSRQAYEDGMARVFSNCFAQLEAEGRFVIVFANKRPEAWETLVAAIIRAGFVVESSLPIMTEMRGGIRNLARASLSSSIWLVCKKRDRGALAGWDAKVLEEMRARIHVQLRDFWDAGIRGPDFVWAATGPALEAYSRHPIVKKADRRGEFLSVAEFLRAVRRIVVDFVVGRVLSETTHTEAISASEAGLDDITTYYLLHRHDFGVDEAPAGACILYALSCNLTESELAGKFDLLVKSGGVDSDGDGEADQGDADAEGEVEEGTGATFKLKPWKQRRRQGLGEEPLGPRKRAREQTSYLPGLEPPEPIEIATPIPLIDQAHRLMLLWKDGDVIRVDQYLEDHGLRRSRVFAQVLQALVELSAEGSEERSVLESVMNHLRERGEKADTAPTLDFN